MFSRAVRSDARCAKGLRSFLVYLRAWLFVLLILGDFFGLTVVAQATPAIPSIEGHLTDASRRLSEAERNSIDILLGSFQASFKVDVAMVVLANPVPSLDETSQTCFDTWGIGKSWERGGILLVVSSDLKDCSVVTTRPPKAPIRQTSARQLEVFTRRHLQNGDLPGGLTAAAERVKTMLVGVAPSQNIVGNPPVPSIEGHLTDGSRRISAADRKSIDDQLAQLQDDAQVDMAILVMGRPTESLEEMGKSCFRAWKIGQDRPNGGLLVVVSQDFKDCTVAMTDSEFPLPGSSSTELARVVRARLQSGLLVEALSTAIGRVRNVLLSNSSQRSPSGNPPVPGIESHLTDASKQLSLKDRQSIDELLGSIQSDTKVDAVVYILAFPVKSLNEMAKTCFSTWSIGKSWEGGGILLLISQDMKHCSVAMSSRDTPLKSEVALQLEKSVSERLSQGQATSAIRFAAERLRRYLSMRRRPTVQPPFKPNMEGTRQYCLGAAMIVLLAGVSGFVRQRKS